MLKRSLRGNDTSRSLREENGQETLAPLVHFGEALLSKETKLVTSGRIRTRPGHFGNVGTWVTSGVLQFGHFGLCPCRYGLVTSG